MQFYGFIEHTHTCTQNTRTPLLQLLLHVICCHCDEKLSHLKMEKALWATSGMDLNDFSILSQNLIVYSGPTDASQAS